MGRFETVLLSSSRCLNLYANLLPLQQHQLKFLCWSAADSATCIEKSQFSLTLEANWAWSVTGAAWARQGRSYNLGPVSQAVRLDFIIVIWLRPGSGTAICFVIGKETVKK